jgi:hypothetical protein
MNRTRLLSALLSGLVLLALGSTTASDAATPAPWWHLNASMRPANLAPGGEAKLIVRTENVGTAATAGPVTLSDQLPGGTTVTDVSFYAYRFGEALDFGTSGILASKEFCKVEGPSVVCSTAGTEEFLPPLLPFENLEMVITVKAEPELAPGAEERAEVSGGGAGSEVLRRSLDGGAAAPGFGGEEFSQRPEAEGGATETAAGSHPFQLTTTFNLNQTADPARPAVLPKNLSFNLPPGLVGDATHLPQCTERQFTQVEKAGFINECPNDTAIGVASLVLFEPNHLGLKNFVVPLFNLTPQFGEPARFGFAIIGTNVVLDPRIRSDGVDPDYGISVDAKSITQLTNFISSDVTFWGNPAAAIHDNSRGWTCLAEGRVAVSSLAIEDEPCAASAPGHHAPFLTMPTSCSTPFRPSVEGVSWPNPAFPEGTAFGPLDYQLAAASGEPLSLTGCNQLAFAPAISARPTASSAASPSGLDFDLDFHNEGLESETGASESEVKKVVVTLPKGVTTNPSVAGGLSACSLAQYEAETLSNQGCPESSKVGEVEIKSPLVEPIIHGAIYVAKQHENPANNLLSIYMVAKNPELGVLVRSAGAVSPDATNGQLTTTFDELPQLPFSHFHLHFREGQRAPLITPGLCGSYAAQTELYPYSAPNEPVGREATFTVNSGAGGGACATSESQLPNAPLLEAGTTSPVAGAYAPFVFKLSREEGSQYFSSIGATLPEGLLGKLAGITECSNAAIAQAQSRSGEGQGALEAASPSCPASSQVGNVNVGTGAGTQPYYVQGKAYLAGPYKGAPLSLAIITPAIAGPFDLGTVVVRTALHVDETTAQIHAVSDPLPTILHGLPLDVRSVSLQMNRPNFTVNPTSCEAKQVAGSETSTLGAVAQPTTPFQVGACAALAFKPTLKLFFSGKTKRTGNPALKAVLTQPKGDNANIARTSVVLPKGMLIAEAHVSNPCTRVVFNSTAVPGEACPPKSVLGHAKVWTPLLEKPEEGPVYFRSNGGERELPDLVVALRGQIPVQLVGFIDSIGKKGAEVRRVRTRFQSVPDAPISRFELKLSGGKKGLLENSTNLCKSKQVSTLQLTGQNGKAYDTEPAVQVSCGNEKTKGGGKKKGK